MNEEASHTNSHAGAEAQVEAPNISLPKGGGAIQGIGEKFASNMVTGTGAMTVPIATTPGRFGAGPKLSLSYNSGSGNSPFGFGWSLKLPSITRKTSKGLPRYEDDQESDVFLLSDADDLVPVVSHNGQPFVEMSPDMEYRIHRYRPRIEGLFARIERWTRILDPSDVHWRSISNDNLLTLYGKDAESRIVDPIDPRRIFSWLICETRDDRGNGTIYHYRPEDGIGADVSAAHQTHRGSADSEGRTANRYLKRILYGNRTPLLDSNTGKRPSTLSQAAIASADWMFEVVLDYGEHNADVPRPDDVGKWTHRADAFSTYRSGFEVRTARLCQRVLMFHHFPDESEVGANALVRSTDFNYAHEDNPGDQRKYTYAFLRSVTHCGYARTLNEYAKRSMPQVEFYYSEPNVQGVVNELDDDLLDNLPIGVDGATYRWADLHGEGIPGILTEQGGSWYYKRNLSPIASRPVEFSPLELVSKRPNTTLAPGGAQLMDLAGDGLPDVVDLNGPAPGFWEHDGKQGWANFRSFRLMLNRNTNDPDIRFVDLDGDGRAEVLISETEAFVWHPSLGEDGFGAAQRVQKALDETQGPRLVFSDTTQSVHLADLSGDGLTDLVRIRNGEVCYWPNLGYARFGARVIMDSSPIFDIQDQFDQMRIRIADIDGSGTSDIIYLHRDGARLYFNQSGNSWTPAQTLAASLRVDELSNLATTDLLGNGTACLVWSSPAPSDNRRPLRYVDLMGGQKPHLLNRVVNNLGTETTVSYASSTQFYLRDKQEGKPWITKLAFPVHVVERVDTWDRISGNRFTSNYTYHHGYFDGAEREFRGFGMVEQRDTEALATLSSGVLAEASNLGAAFNVPPVVTKSWYHTGIHMGRNHVSDYFAGTLEDAQSGEYYREPDSSQEEAAARLLPDTILPPGLTLDEEREACRALKGSMLRKEVYAEDGTAREGTPYLVQEQNFTVRLLQGRHDQRHAVFLVHPREVVNSDYERHSNDPRVGHELTLEVDDFGNVLRSVSIGYGRRTSSLESNLTDRDRQKQNRLLISYSHHRFAITEESIDSYRSPRPASSRTFEITGLLPEGGSERFSFEELLRNGFDAFESPETIGFEKEAHHGSPQRRILEHVQTLYRSDDLTTLLPLESIESLALLGESYQLALTPALLAEVYKLKVPGQPEEDLLPANVEEVLEGRGEDQGGYVFMDGGWWIPSGRAFYDQEADHEDPTNTAAEELAEARAHFFMVRKVVDPFLQPTFSDYDAYDLLLRETRDALGNAMSAANDYRVLKPSLVTDANGNRNAVVFDTLGLVVATAVMGKEGDLVGDTVEGVASDLTTSEVQTWVSDPAAGAALFLGSATSRMVYDLDRWTRTQQPPFVATLSREIHRQDPGGSGTPIQISFSYSDGFGREIQKKVQAEPGEGPERDAMVFLPSGDVAPGQLARDGAGRVAHHQVSHRWVGSGRVVFNNKGNPVRKYEPFFSSTHLYESEADATDTGVSPVLFYDPVERVVATLHPNYTYEKVVFDAWQEVSYDANDTAAPRNEQTGDPRTDPDISGFVAGYFVSQPATWQTWNEERMTLSSDEPERDAAEKAAVSADTPTVSHLDVLGRSVLVVTRSRYAEVDGTEVEEEVATRTELDVDGQERSVFDALGREVMRYRHDLMGTQIHQASMEAGARWTLHDVKGNPLRGWNSRRLTRRLTYDVLRRPKDLLVTGNGTERVAERTIYGEALGTAGNHRTRVYQTFDAAGVVTNLAYDFKGNLVESRRDLIADYRDEVDWATEPDADDGSFTTRSSYDALNRPVTRISPDGSIYRATFNESGLLERIDVNLRGAATATAFVTDIAYDSMGQRERIDYGNGASTSYDYDPLTYRLTNMKTIRPDDGDPTVARLFKDPTVLQDLIYTYDPVGNITRITDDALLTVFHDGEQVEPVNDYVYDGLNRLIRAKGREHVAQAAFDFDPPGGNYRDFPFVGSSHPNDLQALRNYLQTFTYDNVGNITSLRHAAQGTAWVRSYRYEEPSQLDATQNSNRLAGTSIGNGITQVEAYFHDDHGNMQGMPHLDELSWDFKDQLRRVDMGGGGTAWYVYDQEGQRIRKVIESRTSKRKNERLYLAGFEIYREYESDGSSVSQERESLHVMDDQQRIALAETLTVRAGSVVTTPDPFLRYQISDHLGSSGLECDQAGSLVTFEQFHAHGTSAFQAKGSAGNQASKRYRHSGKERDDETGLNYFGARYYASWLGRWTACDRVQNVNRYSYVDGQATTAFDVGGLDSNRELMGLDDAAVEASLAADPSLSNVLKLSAKQSAYDLWDGLTAGFVSKHDELFEAREQGQISESEYWRNTSAQGVKSVAVVAVSSATGGAAGAGAKTLGGAIVKGAAHGAGSGALSSTAADLTGQSVELAFGTREGIDLAQTMGAAKSGAISGLVFGGATGGLTHAGRTKPNRAPDAEQSTNQTGVSPPDKTAQPKTVGTGLHPEASSPQPFAMGIEPHLDDFAEQHGATTWKQFDDVENWKPQVLERLSDQNQRVMFNLDGVEAWPGATRAARGTGGATDWELLKIQQNDFPNLEFWQGGQPAGNPFK